MLEFQTTTDNRDKYSPNTPPANTLGILPLLYPTYTLYTVYAYKNVKSRCWGAFDHPFNACACAATPFYMAPRAPCITATLLGKNHQETAVIYGGIPKPKYANFTEKSVIYAF